MGMWFTDVQHRCCSWITYLILNCPWSRLTTSSVLVTFSLEAALVGLAASLLDRCFGMKTKALSCLFFSFQLRLHSGMPHKLNLIWMNRFHIRDLLGMTWPQNSTRYPFLLKPDLWGDGQWQSKAGQAPHCQAKASSWLVWFLVGFVCGPRLKTQTATILPPACGSKGSSGFPYLIHGFQLQLLPQWNGFGCHPVVPSKAGFADWFLFQLTKWCPRWSMVKFWNASMSSAIHACTMQCV